MHLVRQGSFRRVAVRRTPGGEVEYAAAYRASTSRSPSAQLPPRRGEPLQVCNARRHARGAPASSRIESLCGEINQSINYYSDETRSEATTSAASLLPRNLSRIISRKEAGQESKRTRGGGEARSNIDRWARGPCPKACDHYTNHTLGLV